MPALILGPLVRYASEDEASVWVETDGPCEVEVRADGAPPATARTFALEGHHYALVHVTGLPADSAAEYEVRLDGAPVWPEPGSGFPASVVRTHALDGPVRIAFGSCRVAAPHEPPYSLRKDQDPRGREIDALRAMALRMREQPPDTWPHALLMLGDQVYADEVPPGVSELIRRRRDPDVPPHDTIADFEEYAQLYRESWSDPVIRWLLSTVPSAMVFDDHDVHDDWNASHAWVRTMRARGWWDRRIVGAFASYLVYQHWGNLPPRELAEDALYRRVQAAGDGTELLRAFAFRADREVDGVRWSYCRDIGPARVVMVDSRAGRVLAPGRRAMVDAGERRWITEHARGDTRHLVIGTSLPLFVAPGLHHLEAWSEAVCDGAWGRAAAIVGETLRQRLDLEHWAAFNDSFRRMCALLRDVGAGTRGRAPETITVLSGDVHHAYLAEVGFPRGSRVQSAVWQAVCSPFRNPLDSREQRVIKASGSRPAELLTRGLARRAGVPDPPVQWRLAHDEPWFDNQVAWLELHGAGARLVLERAAPVDGGRNGEVRMEQVFVRDLNARFSRA